MFIVALQIQFYTTEGYNRVYRFYKEHLTAAND